LYSKQYIKFKRWLNPSGKLIRITIQKIFGAREKVTGKNTTKNCRWPQEKRVKLEKPFLKLETVGRKSTPKKGRISKRKKKNHMHTGTGWIANPRPFKQKKCRMAAKEHGSRWTSYQEKGRGKRT